MSRSRIIYRSGPGWKINGGNLGKVADEVQKTASGAIVTITDAAAKPAVGLTVGIEPVQDLHGYDHPWPAGGGVNKFAYNSNGDITSRNPNLTRVYSESQVTLSGTVTTVNGTTFEQDITSLVATLGTVVVKSVLLAGTNDTTIIPRMYIYNENNVVQRRQNTYFAYSFTYTEGWTYRMALWVNSTASSGDACNVTIGTQIEAGTTESAYAPYSNICPIDGHNQVTISHSGEDTSDPETLTIPFGSTIYGGTHNVKTGVMTVTDAKIPSYAGETLPSTWISDRDEYIEGETPTTGAQVVYKLDTPTTIQLTAHQLEMLKGINNLWADTGDVELTYKIIVKIPVIFANAPDPDESDAPDDPDDPEPEEDPEDELAEEPEEEPAEEETEEPDEGIE